MAENETTKNISAQKAARNAMQRVESLEALVPQIISATNNALGQQQAQLGQAIEVLDACVQMLGTDAVGKVVAENRREKALAKVAAEAKATADALASGALVAAAEVGPKSVLVMKEFDKDGKESEISRVQFALQQLLPDVQKVVTGKKVGEKFPSPDGSNLFEIMEIYDVVQKAVETAPAAPEATAEAK